MLNEKSEFSEQIYTFKGLWDRESKCGLRIVRKNNMTIAIVTELYDENPGTSVTSWSAQLATELYKEFGNAPERFIFVERNPNFNSKLSFYDESFFIVDYEWDGQKFQNPKWTETTREKVHELIS